MTVGRDSVVCDREGPHLRGMDSNPITRQSTRKREAIRTFGHGDDALRLLLPLLFRRLLLLRLLPIHHELGLSTAGDRRTAATADAGAEDAAVRRRRPAERRPGVRVASDAAAVLLPRRRTR